MVIENIGLGHCSHKLKWAYKEFYALWGQAIAACNECVWIVPGTIED